MSVQLILYPQDYSGYSYSGSSNLTQYVADWLLNGSFISNTAIIGGSAPFGQTGAVKNTINPVVGGWKGWYIDTPNYWGATSAPTMSGGIVTLNSSSGTATGSLTGIMQRINNLVQGEDYDIYITYSSSSGSGNILVGLGGAGTSPYSLPPFTQTLYPINSVGSSVLLIPFTAGSAAYSILSVGYQNTINSTLEISSISVVDKVTATSAIVINDGQVICDLYQEEDIPLTLSVDDFTNIAEKVQSYSKDFNLPNTKRNSKIFTHIFDITKTIQTAYDFNPYAKTRAVLKQDGILIFEGSLRLIDIQDQEGEISYNVNLYSETIALSEVLKAREFSDLDFSELEHTYDKVSIKSSWDSTGVPLTNPLPANSFAGAQGATNTQVLKYPFINWQGNIMIANGVTGNASVIGYPELKTLEQAFRPFIKIKYLLDNIFFDVGYSFTSAFFDTSDFDNLFMDFNWGAENAPQIFNATGWGGRLTDQDIGTSFTTLDFDNSFQTLGQATNLGYSSGVFTASADNQQYNVDYNMNFDWEVLSIAETLDVEWVKTSGGVEFPIDQVIGQTGLSFSYAANFSVSLDDTDTLHCRAKASDINKIDLEGTGLAFWTPLVTISTSAYETTDESLLDNLRGELNQWDFFKGIMTMFNLVTMPDPQNPNNILIEPYNDVFGVAPTAVTPTELDWTYKVDTKDIKLSPLDLKKNVIFQYEEDEDDYAFRVYKNSTSGYLYGSKEVNGTSLFGGQETLLTGEEKIVASPFAATIMKPLGELWQDFIVPVIYSSNDDGTEFEGFENMPRILYDNGKVDSGISYYIPAQNGEDSENQTDFLQFSHISEIPSVSGTTLDYNFGICQLIGQTSPIQNLFYLHYQEYFSELYNVDTRTMTLKVLLNASDINTFKFYDRIMIKNRKFKANKINYKPNELSVVEFILLS